MKESYATSFALALLLVGISVGVALTSPNEKWQLAQVGSSTSGTSNSGSGGASTGSIPVTYAVTVSSDLICDTTGVVRRTVGFFTEPIGGGYFSLYGAGGTDYGDRQPGLYDLPAGIYTWEGHPQTGFMRTGTYAGSFTIGGTCSQSAQTNTATTTATATPPPPPPPPISPTTDVTSLLPVVVGVRTGTACTVEKNMTQVAVEIDPPSAARVVFTNQSGNVMTSSSQGLVYFPNGTYAWKAEPSQGYRVATGASGTFSLGSCSTHVRVSVSPGTTCDLIDEGVPVMFSLTPNISANFTVTNVNTGDAIPVRPGVEYFENGSYRWVLVPPSGVPLSLEGASSGNFSVTQCKTSLSAPYVPPEPGTILFFRDGKLVEPRVRQGERVALRIDTSVATALSLELVARDERTPLGAMEREANSDRWLFVWNVGDIPSGAYTIVTHGKHKTQGEYTVGSRVVTIESGKTSAVSAPIAPEFPPEPTRTSPTLDEFADLGEIEIPDIPVFEDIHFTMPEDSSSALPIRGVGDLIPVEMILAAHKSLPDAVQSPEDLRVFCAHESNDTECLKLLPERLRKEAQGAIDEARKEITRVFEDRKVLPPGTPIDTDQDGIPDFDEEWFFGTDPDRADSDGDGRRDGDELLAQENPIAKEPAPTLVQFENPNLGGGERPDLLAVEDIEVFEGELAVSVDEGVTPFVISGQALPNSIVTIYIYSDPIIVRVKAGDDGLWSYTVTKELSDGSHKAYVAMTDSAGRVLAKSAPLPFVKQAAAISITPSVLPGVEDSAPGLLSGGSLYAFILILAGVLGFAVLAIGMVIRRSKADDVVL